MGCVCMSNITMMELSRELDEQFDRLVNECRVSGEINQELYTEYDVKRGLRDANGKGPMSFHIKVWMERRCLQMENCISRDTMYRI